MRRAGHVLFLMVVAGTSLGLFAEWNTRLLTGERFTGRMGTMDRDRIPFTTGWSTEPLWVPVRQLHTTQFPVMPQIGSFSGYHVIFTNHDRLFSKNILYSGETEVGLQTSWGMENAVNKQTLDSVWMTSRAGTGDAQWHMVMPAPSWWFHLERGKSKPMEVDWKRSQDGTWVFGKNRMSSGLRLPKTEKGLEIEMDLGDSARNFRIRFLTSFDALKNNSNAGIDFILNSSQIMLRRERKMIYRRMINQEFPDLHRFRMVFDVEERKASFWLNDRFVEEVQFPNDIHPKIPRLMILEPFTELKLTQLSVIPILEKVPAEFDQLWLRNGNRIVGALSSWSPEEGIRFLKQGESAPSVHQPSDVMGIRFSSHERVEVKRTNRDVLVRLSDGFSRLHLPLSHFTEESLTGAHPGWRDAVQLPLTQVQSIRWNPYTLLLQDPISPLTQWAGEGRK